MACRRALKQLDVTPQEERAAVAISSMLGETEAATSAEEIAWAFRKTLEQVALKRPLVVVFDDIQWGEDTFLDLIEHVAPFLRTHRSCCSASPGWTSSSDAPPGRSPIDSSR